MLNSSCNLQLRCNNSLKWGGFGHTAATWMSLQWIACLSSLLRDRRDSRRRMKSKSSVPWGKAFLQPGSVQILRLGSCYSDCENKWKLFFNYSCGILQIQDINLTLWFYKHCNLLIYVSLFFRRGSPALSTILSFA